MTRHIAGLAVAVVVFLSTTTVVAAQGQGATERDRRFLFELGVGPGFVAVADEYRDLADTGDADDAMRLPLNVRLGLGYAVLPGVYVTLVADSTSDVSLDLFGGSVVQASLYGVGVRVYPGETGFTFGGHGGIALVQAGTESTLPAGTSDSISDVGFGIGGIAGYDFGRRRSGFSLLVAATANLGIAGGEPFGTVGLTASALWK